MKLKANDEVMGLNEEGATPKKVPYCLMTRIAFYGCLGLAVATLVIFIVSNRQ